MDSGAPILGQHRALAALGRALASGRVHHAWILHGPPGVGKFRTAEAFARTLLDPASG
ncbi:MAG: DNA polymerase III subunit delta', partial [Phycisphaerales bacterium]